MLKRILFALALVLVSASLCTAQDKPLINGIDADFPPFAFVDKDGKPTGFDVEALDWIANEMGFKVVHQPTAWDGIVTSLTTKKIDMVASGMSVNPKRQEAIDFTIPYHKVEQVLVAKKDSKLTPETAMEKGKKIGAQRGTTEAKWIQENLLAKGKKFELVEYDKPSLAVEDVLNGRIAAAAMDDAPAKEFAKEKPVKVVGTFGMPAEQFAYGVRKEDTELKAKLNEGLKKLMASPKWTELKAKYKVD